MAPAVLLCYVEIMSLYLRSFTLKVDFSFNDAGLTNSLSDEQSLQTE